MIYSIHCKNLCKCHNVPPPSTIIKKKRKLETLKMPEENIGEILQDTTQAKIS
jgi:hypothetical protein